MILMLLTHPHLVPPPPRSTTAPVLVSTYRAIGRDDPVFLSSRLLIYTSMEPTSQSHLSRSCFSCPTSPPTVDPTPSHRNRAPVLAPLYRAIDRDDPVFLSSRLLIYTSMDSTSQSYLSRSCFSCPSSPPTVYPTPSHSNRAPVLAPIYHAIGRDDPVFLSSRLLIYTSMEPSSECHVRRSWCSCSQFPPCSLPPLSTQTGKS